MIWCPPFPKDTNDIGKLTRKDLWKRENSRERFEARKDAEPIPHYEFWIGHWMGFRFIQTKKGL